MKESNLIKQILLELPANRRLFRNSVGVGYSETGQVIRFGLCVGSSDLIGWESIVITPEMVGKKLAIFTALEVKTGKTAVSKEQKQFLEEVKNAGGNAEIIRK